jgi:hypothetical protein
MNIIEMEDMVKGLPDQLLMQEAQAPSGRIPQFLALSEVQRRKDMRDRFQQQAPQQTVKDMILGGTAGPPSPQPPPIPGGTQPGGAPPQPVMAYGGGRMPNMYADGGSISAGQQAEAVKQASSAKAGLQDFFRQNFATPQGLGRLAAGALGTAVGGPLAGYAASQGFNRLFPMGPSALEKAVQNVQTANNPFGMYGQSFSDAGAVRQAEMDHAGAMALGNRYEGYLNRMTNPFAGTGSGIVRDERLGDDSLNMGLGAFTGMAGGGHVPGTIFMQSGKQVDIYKLANLSATDRERITRQFERLGMNADFVRQYAMSPQNFDALPLAERKQLFERLAANEAGSPQVNAPAPGNLEQYTGAYGRLQGTPDIRLLIEQGSPDQIKTAFAESIQAGDDQTASVIQRMAVGRGKADQGELLDIGKQLRLLRGQQQSQLRASERAAASEQEKLAQQSRANYLLTGQQPPAAAPPVAATAPPAAAPTAEAAPVDTMAPGVTPASPDINMLGMFQQIRSGMKGTGGTGIPTEAQLKPFTDFFAVDTTNPALQAPSFAPLIAQQEARGKERAAAYEQSIKRIEDEMKRERLGAVLTTLGSSLMAGEGAIGLEKAGTIAQQIGKEMRQEVGAERRAAKAAEDATSDRIFALNAQQLTADKEAQRAIFTAQQGVKEKAFNAFSKVLDNEVQANQAANQLAATLTVGAVNSMRDKIVTEGANARAVLDFAKEQARGLKDALGTSTVGMKPDDIRKIVEDTLRSGIITGYAAIGQAPPAGLEAQIAAAAAVAAKSATGTQGSTASQSNDPLGVR